MLLCTVKVVDSRETQFLLLCLYPCNRSERQVKTIWISRMTINEAQWRRGRTTMTQQNLFYGYNVEENTEQF